VKVLVTGANGFIGRHAVKALKEAGHEAITLDQEWYRAMDIAADITKPLSPIPGLDAVIHLAAMASPKECDGSPSRAFDVNVHGTHEVLKMALKSGAKKVVFASSAHVYDIPPMYFPTDELHPLRLNNTYTTTKLLGEELCRLYFENHGLSYTALRFYNVYGPGQALGYFVPDMIMKAKSGSIELPGGNTTKDFVYVGDVAQAIMLAMKTSFVGAINIGTGVESNLALIAGRIAESLGVSFSTTPSATATRMQADSSRAQTVLGWKATTDVTTGLERIFQYKGIKVVA